jgi:hypothetical protein
MDIILDKYYKSAIREQVYGEEGRKNNWQRKDILRRLLKLLRGEEEQVTVDESTLAEGWLDIIRPTWYTHLTRRRRGSRPLQLKDIRQDLLQQPLETDALASILELDLFTRPLDTRIVATILGVPPLEG